MASGDDDTIAGSLPALAGARSSTPEVIGGRYRVTRWLGGGGMGNVYEVHDVELDERVALKMLRGGLSDAAVERFRREVRLTRRIQHRNVARMFDLGEHAGDRFLTMELVDGAPLTNELGQPWPWPRLHELAVQLCAGLEAAHAAGVVHRDLKPDNILVERDTGRVVITDFGIARGQDDVSVTEIGALIGTPRYMAPEQLAGADVDPRTDLFALGVILHELATGHRPWAGDNPITLAVAQVTQPPPPVASPELPAALGALIARCLELERERRPASAAEIGATIDRLAAHAESHPSPPAARPPRAVAPAAPALARRETTLAVLAFHCDARDAYLGDGLREELIDLLSTTPSLRVRPARAASEQADSDPQAVGRELGVDHVIVGSLRRTDTGLRITARMISVADGFQIWAHKSECDCEQVLRESEQLAHGIAAALSTRAAPAAQALDPRAVDLYLRARAELRRFWSEHVTYAMELLDQAAAFAPGSPQIECARALASVQAWMRSSRPELRAKAHADTERALATGDGEALYASALLRANEGEREVERSAREFGLALARSPMYAPAHDSAGRLLAEVGEVVAARQHYETAAGLDPGRGVGVQGDLARLDLLQGNWTGAERRIAALLADPDPPISQLGALHLARLALVRRDNATFSDAMARLAPRIHTAPSTFFQMYAAHLQRHELDEARWREMTSALSSSELPGRRRIIDLVRACEFALGMERTDLALDALRLASDAGMNDIYWLDNFPLWTPLRGTAAFEALAGQIADRAARMLAAFRSATG